MNKKLFSAALFGALLLGTASTFVSCKDYDDDIAGLQTQINDVKATVSALEAKIGAGKFVTGVNTTADGITISLSDGTSYTVANGKNGANGTDGINGTEWTISEDGFWVCNGEKTEIQAVGQKGEAGENGTDAQPEVKKENGKWYLWNGTEFEEFTTSEAPAAENIPYCFVDPNDANYMNLVVYTEAGEKVTMKLPLNEGLGQIKILDYSFNAVYNMMTSTMDKWDGAKALPTKGDYIVGKSNTSFVVEVTPTSYDLSGKVLKAVNSLGEELPLELGAAVPYTGLLSRTASATGLYEIPVLDVIVNDETVEAFSNSMNFSLVANDKVYSGFTAGQLFQLTNWASVSSSAATTFFGESNPAGTSWSSHIYAKAGETTIVANRNPGIVYDSYLVMRNASAKADSVRYGVKIEGMAVTANADVKDHTLEMTVKYYTVGGQLKTQNISLDYSVATPDPEVVGEIESTAHTATFNWSWTRANEQSFVADLAPYFESMTANRLVWNDDFGGIVLHNYSTATAPVKWVYDDPNDGRTKTVYLNLINRVVPLDADGDTAGAADIANLYVEFNNDYSFTAVDENGSSITALSMNDLFDNGGQFTLQVAVQDRSSNNVDLIEIPFTIAAPTAETIASVVEFDPAFYADGILTILNTTRVDLAAATNNTITFDANTKLASALEWQTQYTVVQLKSATANANMGKALEITKGKVTVMGAIYQAPAFKVKFVNTTDYTMSLAKELEVVCDNANPIKIRINNYVTDANGKPITTGYYTLLTASNFAGVQKNLASVSVVECDAYGTPLTTGQKLSIGSITADEIPLTTVSGRIANDVTTYIKISATVDGNPVEKIVSVTVKANM